MKLIVGLGNPGAKYETTRHNVGFLALDRLVERWKAQGPLKKYQAEVFQSEFDTKFHCEKVLLLKPETFMNLSGKSVAAASGFYHCESEDLIVIHDDLDLTPFSVRLKKGGGSGGHNGLKSLDECLGNQDYYRVRIGIGHPTSLGLPISPVNYVLQQYTDSELETLDPLLDRVCEAVEKILEGDFLKAMTEFNQKEKGIKR